MIRRIIEIDAEQCDGCGLCVNACHEGAIGLVDGKAVLLRDDYCDGLGNCLPACPTGAIHFIERDAAAFDAAAVEKNVEANRLRKPDEVPTSTRHEMPQGGCPGSRMRALQPTLPAPSPSNAAAIPSQLRQWPVQIQLVPIHAPYFENAHLLIAADCAAYAHGSFHATFMQGKITIIGCPKLDEVEYSEKLTAILAHNNIKSVTIVRMEVPCCGGLASAAVSALQQCGKMIPWQVVTLGTNGEVLAQ